MQSRNVGFEEFGIGTDLGKNIIKVWRWITYIVQDMIRRLTISVRQASILPVQSVTLRYDRPLQRH